MTRASCDGRGFTVADLVVGLALGALVVGVLMAALGLVSRREPTGSRNQCLAVALRAQQQIEADLTRVLRRPLYEPLSLGVDEESDALGFWAVDTSGEPRDAIFVQAVGYITDARGVLRVEGDRTERVAGPHLERIRFLRWDRSIGTMLRVTLTIRDGTRELTHCFVVRLRVSPSTDSFRMDRRSAFSRRELEPTLVVRYLGPDVIL